MPSAQSQAPPIPVRPAAACARPRPVIPEQVRSLQLRLAVRPPGPGRGQPRAPRPHRCARIAAARPPCVWRSRAPATGSEAAAREGSTAARAHVRTHTHTAQPRQHPDVTYYASSYRGGGLRSRTDMSRGRRSRSCRARSSCSRWSLACRSCIRCSSKAALRCDLRLPPPPLARRSGEQSSQCEWDVLASVRGGRGVIFSRGGPLAAHRGVVGGSRAGGLGQSVV
jgi:hypothetical protein